MAKKKQNKKTARSGIRSKRSEGRVVKKQAGWDLSQFWQKDRGLDSRQLRLLSYVMLVVTLIMCLLSIRVGLNGDDDVQANYSDDLPSFYTSFGRDTTCFVSGPEIKYYGALFELTTGVTNGILGFDKSEPGYFTVRHVWNAIFGCIAIYFLALLCGEVAGFSAGLLSIGLMFLTLRFMGHSLFNPKDIPFAAGYMVSIYYIYQLLKQMPQPSRKTLIGLSAGIAMSVGVRVGGVLVIAYLAMFLGLYFWAKHGLSALFSKEIKPYFRSLWIPSLAGLVGALLVWPYGIVNPFQNIPKAFEAFSNFQVAIKVLFDGQMVWSRDIPFRYLLTWIGLTIPVFTLVGIILFAVFAKGILRKYNVFALVLTGFAFVFPITYVLISGSILYDGWRHFLFTYPPLVFIVTLSWQYLIEKKQNDRWQYMIWGLLALTAVDSAIFLVRNSAFPYVYFNPLGGGMKGAYGDYELDYWGASVKQAVEALEDQGIIAENMTDTITLASNFSHAAQVYTKKYNGKVKINYVRWRQRYDKPWDYGIFVNRFVDGSYLKQGYWPTSKTIHTVDANGVPIALIEKDAVNSPAYLGAMAISQQNWDEAIQQLTVESQSHPDNEMAWIGLGMAHLNRNQLPQAKIALDQAIKIVPDNQNALNFMGYYHYTAGNLNEARPYFIKAAELHQTNSTAFYYLGRIEMMQNNHSAALARVQDCIDANGNFPNCYQLGAEVYQAMGDQPNAQRYLDAFNRLVGR
ncbi:MAG: phospholipid carrier-dependent glycosyltransferase [Saprospiraceae bacterium]|nr:phospholipid carrier-dependent glycosyltransferase [Saprospiraceae bacterium]